MTNIAKLLKDAPNGLKLYSPLFGEVKLMLIQQYSGHIIVKAENYSCNHEFYKDGRYFDNPYSECLLFPSKGIRTWEGWKLHKPHYNISNFKPFDKVLVRCSNDEEWMIEFYCKYDTLVHTSPHRDYPFMGIGDSYSQCIPYNDDTKHLLGTTNMCDECYVNW